MTDMEGMMPELTLNADAAKVEAPSLTLSLEPEAPAPEKEDELLQYLQWLEDNDHQNFYCHQLSEEELDPLSRVGTDGGLEETLFRFLSRNIPRRRAENLRFMRAAGPIMSWLRLRRNIRRDKEHVYFKCPSCGQQLRVPRGKGKITVTCRGCGASFQEKS